MKRDFPEKTTSLPPTKRPAEAVEPPSLPAGLPAGLRIVVAGRSDGPICGVRDHARVVSASLEAAGASVSTVWSRSERGAPDVRRWAADVRRRCEEERAEVVLLHYSVFAFSRRGVPVDVPMLAARLARLGLPVVLFAHEYAYPWGRRGWRGGVQAATQRAALLPLVGACAATIVTTAVRAGWVRTRWWLPRRPATVAPVFATIDPHPSAAAGAPRSGRVGIFGFGAEGLAVELVTGAVADVARRSPHAHLALIGAPGPQSTEGARWREAAAWAGCPLVFTGVANEVGISGELVACEVIVFADPAGPTTRKTSLASALAHGRAVLALDGPETWRGFVDAGALTLVEADQRSLAAAIERFLVDPDARIAAGSRARSAYETHLSPEKTIGPVLQAIATSITGRERGEPPGGKAGRGASTAVETAGERPAVTLVAHDIHHGGGMERACAELIRHTHRHVRYTVVAATLDPVLEPLVERWLRIRAPSRPFPLKFGYFYIVAGLALRRTRTNLVHTVGAIVPNRIDLVTIQFCHAGFRANDGRRASTGAPRLRRVNSAVTRALAIGAERWSYRPGRVRSIAAVSAGVGEEVSDHYRGLPVSMTPNGVDVLRFQPDEAARRWLRGEQRAGENSCVAVFVGGDWERKGLGLAVEGLAKARAEGSDVALWVVGAGDEGRYRALARRLDVEGVVTFFGRRGDTERWYQAADVLVLPSAYEAFSLVCLEAAASGLPLIIPRMSGAEELVGDDEAGIIVGRDASSVGAALHALADDPPRRAELGLAARRRACTFTWDASAAAVADLYAALLSQSGPASSAVAGPAPGQALRTASPRQDRTDIG